MFNIYQYYSKDFVEDLRKTLKGTVEHKVYAMFLTANNVEDMDKYFQRMLDLRFERRKMERQVVMKVRAEYERDIATERRNLALALRRR